MEKGRAKDEKKQRRKSGGGKTEGRGTDSAAKRARGEDGIVGTTKGGDTTEETFQMCYRLLNKFRVKLPDLVSTAVAPAGRKWRIKAANLPVFIRLFACSSLRCTATLPPALPPALPLPVKSAFMPSLAEETKSRAIDTRDECQRRDCNQLITRSRANQGEESPSREEIVFRRKLAPTVISVGHRSLVIIDTEDSHSFSVMKFSLLPVFVARSTYFQSTCISSTTRVQGGGFRF